MSAGADLALRLEGVGKRYGEVEALAPLDLQVEEGEFVVLVGPSGCGKTTLLRIVAGLETPSSGRVLIGAEDVTEADPADRDVAMVFQNFALYPHMTVRDNLAFGLRMRRLERDVIERQIAHAAAILELGALLNRRPGQLSGGQRQRVALGRAIVREPRLFLFDEPLSNLDAQLRTQTRHEIAELHARLGATTIFVTHDQTEAMTLGNRIAVMRDGHLLQYGTPLTLYREPATLAVARFIGTPRINDVDGVVSAAGFTPAGASQPCCAVPAGTPHGPATLAVRPESITLTDTGDDRAPLAATVSRLEPLGNETLVYVRGPGPTPWIVRTPPDPVPTAGDVVGLRIDPAAVHLFDPGGRRYDPA